MSTDASVVLAKRVTILDTIILAGHYFEYILKKDIFKKGYSSIALKAYPMTL